MSAREQPRSGRGLAVVAIVAGLLETGFSLVMGAAGQFILPLFGATALVLGAAAFQKAALGQPARRMAAVAIVSAVLGAAAVAFVLWFLAHMQFTF